MSDGCLFCRIVRGEIPAAIVARSARAIAFRDIAPAAPVHVLVIPTAHLGSLDAALECEAPGALLGELLVLAHQVAVQEGVADSGYRVVTNTNADGGQSVAHLHFHVLGGRPMRWPPG